MQQSVIYQEWREKFLQKGKIAGKLEEARSLILRQLARRVGNISPSALSQIQDLPLAQIKALGEALLDFSKIGDLTNWLQMNQT